MKLNDLMYLSDDERHKKIEEFIENSNRPEVIKKNIDDLKKKIANYESKNKMTTAEMKQLLENGTITETNEICNWLIEADLYEQVLKEHHD